MDPRFQCCAGGCAGGCTGGCAGGLIIIDGSRLLRAVSCYISKLLTGPEKRPLALVDNHHLLFLVYDDMGDGLEALFVLTDGEDVVTVCRHIGSSRWCHHFHAAILTEVSSKRIPSQLYWDVARGHSYPRLSFIFWIEPEILR